MELVAFRVGCSLLALLTIVDYAAFSCWLFGVGYFSLDCFCALVCWSYVEPFC